MARAVWALADAEVTEHLHCSDERRAREWLANMMSTLSQENQTRVFVTLWAIWHARRRALHDHEFQSPMSVHLFVGRFVADIQLSDEQKPRRLAPAGSTRSEPSWIPPPRGVMKINVDAAVGKNMGFGSIAAVARDEDGVFRGASAVVLNGKSEAETLEALACREALSLAQDINARRI
jgi:hypothetical protein